MPKNSGNLVYPELHGEDQRKLVHTMRSLVRPKDMHGDCVQIRLHIIAVHLELHLCFNTLSLLK